MCDGKRQQTDNDGGVMDGVLIGSRGEIHSLDIHYAGDGQFVASCAIPARELDLRKMRDYADLSRFRHSGQSEKVNGDFRIRDGVLLDAGMDREFVIIPEGVRLIAMNAFERKSRLRHVTLPSSLERVDSCAFSECCHLKSIEIPAGVTSIGSEAFRDCRSLQKVTFLPKSVEFGWNVFSGCISLKTMELPCECTRIPNGMFSGCTSLQRVTGCGNVTKYGVDIFRKCHGADSPLTPWKPFDYFEETADGFERRQKPSFMSSYNDQYFLPVSAERLVIMDMLRFCHEHYSDHVRQGICLKLFGEVFGLVRCMFPDVIGIDWWRVCLSVKNILRRYGNYLKDNLDIIREWILYSVLSDIGGKFSDYQSNFAELCLHVETDLRESAEFIFSAVPDGEPTSVGEGREDSGWFSLLTEPRKQMLTSLMFCRVRPGWLKPDACHHTGLLWSNMEYHSVYDVISSLVCAEGLDPAEFHVAIENGDGMDDWFRKWSEVLAAKGYAIAHFVSAAFPEVPELVAIIPVEQAVGAMEHVQKLKASLAMRVWRAGERLATIHSV